MNRQEYLLVCLGEECDEVALQASKALRFGMGDHEPGKIATNETRILQELSDLMAVVEMLQESGAIRRYDEGEQRGQIIAKKARVEHFMNYSREKGTLE